MGLKALVEDGFPVTPRPGPAGRSGCTTSSSRTRAASTWSSPTCKAAFEDAFVAVWTGRTENDGFNRLVLELGVPWREAALIRALARYRQQSGLDPSQRGAGGRRWPTNPDVARLILDLFRTKFDPATGAGLDERAGAPGRRGAWPRSTRRCRRWKAWTTTGCCAAWPPWSGAIQRTNFYQPGEDGGPKPYICFKVASRELADLPAPKPYPRDLRLARQRRGRAPALRPGGARRPALVATGATTSAPRCWAW